MRLNFNNIGRGLEAIAGAKQARDLAQTSARYDVTEGAYGPGLQENITQLEGLKAQDPSQAAAYDQAIAELTRRQGLTAPDYSVASGPTNFETRQEARQAAAPMRAEGLAGVYRRYGDVERADALEARAQEQQRALSAEARAQAAENRAQQSFATGMTETGLRINQLLRNEGQAQRASDFANFAAENPNATVAELKEAAFKQFKFTPKQWQETVATRLQIETGEMDIFKNSIKKKLQGKNLAQIGELYNTDADFDDKTDLAIVPGKGGAVTLNFIDKATGRVTSTQSFKNEALATEYLNKQATEPENIGSWMLALRKTESGIAAQEAQIRASDATVGLRNQQQQMLTNQAAERPALSAADVTSRAKALVESRTPSLTNPKKPMTLPEAIAYVEGGMRNPIAERLDAALGGGGDPFAPPAAGGGAPQQPGGLTRPAAAPAPARNAPVEPNPYVDARGRPLAVAPTGAPSVASTTIPAAVAAVEGTLGTQAAATRYLQAKIARNEPLSPTERARAQQMGLIR